MSSLSPTLEHELTKSRGSAFSPCAAPAPPTHQEVLHKCLASELTEAPLCPGPALCPEEAGND